MRPRVVSSVIRPLVIVLVGSLAAVMAPSLATAAERGRPDGAALQRQLAARERACASS
ncbi:MAG: hypothetical protein ABR600_04770 [Actinomycetota bacterium]|nr:hypothetical protein [Actinomycetota bacterium]